VEEAERGEGEADGADALHVLAGHAGGEVVAPVAVEVAGGEGAAEGVPGLGGAEELCHRRGGGAGEGRAP
jgi:hypothetical protein